MNRQREREPERRREDRLTGAGMRARMRTGYRLVVVDLSACGALVEARRPLRPGSHVDVQFEADRQQATVAARVVRCAVTAIHSEAGVTYRAALSFTETCEWVREAPTQPGYEVHVGAPVVLTSAVVNGEKLPSNKSEGALATRKGAK